MHKLDRNAVPAPACITPHDPARRYGHLHGTHKAEIRTALLTIQKNRCAYCERRTGQAADDGHIEHFQNQAGHEHLETDWNNMFWSCNDEMSCGKRKDKCVRSHSSGPLRSFNPADIIKPCTDDPEHFMIFVSNGTIVSRAGLSADEERRYNETLRVFQLADSPSLCQSRVDAVKPYIRALNYLSQYGPDIVRDYITGELAELDSTPFATAILHFLESNRP